MRPWLAVPALIAVLGALGGLVSCGGDDVADSAAVSAFRRAVWQPSQEASDAARAAGEAVVTAAQGEPTPDDLFLVGASAMLQGDLDRALATLDEVGRAQPGRPGVLLFQGFWHSTRHNRDAARAAFDACIAALRARPDAEKFGAEVEFMAHLFRGQERYFQEDYTGAVDDLEHARALVRAHAAGVHRDVVRFLVDAHVHGQAYVPAEAVIREAIAGDDAFPAHHFQLGMVLAAQARTDEAALAYRRTLELVPGDPLPRLKLAEIARRDQDLPAMLLQLDAIRERGVEGDLGGELSSALGAYWLARAQELQSEGDDDGADAAFVRAGDHLRRAVRTNPMCTRAYALLVQLLAQTGAPEAEIERCKKKLDELEHVKSGTPAASDPNRTFC